MSRFEYQIIQMVAGGRVTHLNERMEAMAAEGWEPIMMSGDSGLNVLMRRAKGQGASPQPPAASGPPQQ